MGFVTGGDKIGDKDFVGRGLLKSFDNAGGEEVGNDGTIEAAGRVDKVVGCTDCFKG